MSHPLFAVAAGVAVGVAGLVAADRVLLAPSQPATAQPRPSSSQPVRPLSSQPPPHAFARFERFPNVTLHTHDGRTVRFYEDLIQGKTVALNFMYVSCKNF